MFSTVNILGSTGSIGKKAVEIYGGMGLKFRSLAAGSDYISLEEQARRWKPEVAALFDERAAAELRVRLADTSTKVYGGADGVIEAASIACDMALSSIVGIAGLLPSMAALDSCKRLALANKETLVCAGRLVLKKAEDNGVEIIPVDSEHSAIFQSLAGNANRSEIKRLILTASGGPFYGYTADALERVGPGDALKHPTWSMGAKISIDSATLMNKGLEVIEAMHLFGVEVSQISTVVHRQSIIHSMVEFCDGALLAQLGLPDMAVPISYAATYPERRFCGVASPDFAAIGQFTFAEPDYETFPCLRIARETAERGNGSCTVMNGANERAVELFLNGNITFKMIPELIEYALDRLQAPKNPTLEEIAALDREARSIVSEAAEIKRK